MLNFKVPGLNFDILSKVGAKVEAAAERQSTEPEKAADPEKVSFEKTKTSANDPTPVTAESTKINDGANDEDKELADQGALWVTQYTYDEFIDSLAVDQESRGETPSEKRHWSYPRRWSVKLYNLKIVNCVADTLTCFAEFDFGGSRSECRVQMGNTVCILNKGETKNYIRTTVVQNVVKDVPRSFNCAHEFEYRGSYLDLENEKLKIKLWKYRRYNINCLESIYEGQLLQFATGDIHVEIPMYKGLNEKRHLRCRISFDLYFQELYDFELSFLTWRLSDVPSFVELLCKGKEAPEKLESRSTTSKGKFKDRRRDNMSFSIFDKMKYFFIRKRIERDYYKSHALRRDRTHHLKDDERISLNTLDPYQLLLQSQCDIVFKGNTINQINTALPSLRLQIHVKADSGHRLASSLQLSSLVSKHTRNAYWENMGEIILRGTLMDLERAELEVDIIDVNAPKAANKVGRVVLPLAGIVDYPYLTSKVNTPKWLTLKASMEGWGSVLERLNFGKLSGKIQIQHKPRYRQKTNPSGLSLTSYPAMLVVTVGSVDQLIVDDDNVRIDSYVEVTFNKQSYRTYCCKNNRAPMWNEDVLIPFMVNDVDKINSSVVLQSSPIRFTVWGASGRDRKVVFLGTTVLYPYEIFYTPKGVLKHRVKKTYAENGQYGNMYNSTVFETHVFSGPLKLQFMNEDHQSNLTVSAWLYPDMPDDVMPDQFDPRLVRSEQPQLLSYLMTPYYPRLSEDWQRVVDLKLKPIFKDVGNITVECRTQYHQRVYLPCLITPMHPPMGIDTPNAIFHMVRCLPFVRKSHDIRFTPDFLMQLKGGNAFDHCLLQVSYLRGLIPPVEAFVCVGTTHNGRYHAWVTTFCRDVTHSVKMWESTTGEVHVLKHRIESEADINDSITDRRLRLKTSSKFPYQTLIYMFNDTNVWLNVQGFTDPQLLLFDISNNDLWYPFTPRFNHNDNIHVPQISYVKVNDYDIERISNELQQNVERHLTMHRNAQNLQTRWNKDDALNKFLITGMKLLHQINTCPDADVQLSKCELQDWRVLLNKNIPQSHQVVVVPVHFNTLDAEFIADNIKNNVPLLDSRERFITFAMSNRVISLPGNLFSVYIILLVAQKIHERVRIRLVMEQERLAQKKSKKKSMAVEEDGNEIMNREDSLNESLKAALESNIEMSGSDTIPKKQYSALFSHIDNNLQNKDSQLDNLLSRTFTSAALQSNKNISQKITNSLEADSSLSSLARSSSENDNEVTSSNSSLAIGFENLSSSGMSTFRDVDVVARNYDGMETEMYIANAPSYDFGSGAQSLVSNSDKKCVSTTFRDDVVNPHLLSSGSFVVSSSSSSIGSRLMIQTGSFEYSDGERPEQNETLSQSMVNYSPMMTSDDTNEISRDGSAYGAVDSIQSAVQSMSSMNQSILYSEESDVNVQSTVSIDNYTVSEASIASSPRIIEDNGQTDATSDVMSNRYSSRTFTESDSINKYLNSENDSFPDDTDWSDTLSSSESIQVSSRGGYISSALESDIDTVYNKGMSINSGLVSRNQLGNGGITSESFTSTISDVSSSVFSRSISREGESETAVEVSPVAMQATQLNEHMPKSEPEVSRKEIASHRAFLGLKPEPSIASTGTETLSHVSSDNMSSSKVCFAKTATLYTSNNTPVQVPTHEGNTPSQRLARSLFDKSNVLKKQLTRREDYTYSVCDFKYVDLFRGFL
ncbi:hypothetical protein BBOV_III003050 [Babesia bovis T2Bo]|uniref:C2 domain-containing protein n=1 Tax=Babesia bovis TaxID=5865 RepID=A7AMT5_BABBO|nr:hypothetical protein BBOV_III003050 [Babesia bovis T2Bo]EDO07869.1 hypothetical protein BBOV_III003050 [Babesia bovis T2Bo]|eukprot:XP_001611437.1 hypothetical protein [Babesia bovis T2Bo]